MVREGMGCIMSKMNIKPLATGKITDNLYAIKTGTVNFYIYKTSENIICFDAGFRKSLIMAQLNNLGIDPKDITHLFLTHSDYDHTGGIKLFKKAKIYLCAEEEQMISGKIPRMFGFIRNFKIKRPYSLLQDNDVVTIDNTKIRAITTPGHTLGSMCFLVNESILITGDTVMLVNDKVYPLRSRINMDTEQQKQSIRKLAQLKDINLTVTGHFGYTKEFDKAMNQWK